MIRLLVLCVAISLPQVAIGQSTATSLKPDHDLQERQLAALQKKADVARVIARVEKEISEQIEKLFGPARPGNDDILSMRESLKHWLVFERDVIAPYLVWPDDFMPPKLLQHNIRTRRLKLVPPLEYPPEYSLFLNKYREKAGGLSVLSKARDRIVSAYKKYPRAITRETKGKEWYFSYQLDLELLLLEKPEKAKLLLSSAYATQFEHTNYRYGLSPWETYVRYYYRRAAGKKAMEEGLLRYDPAEGMHLFKDEYEWFDKEARKAGLGAFLDRWMKRIEKEESGK